MLMAIVHVISAICQDSWENVQGVDVTSVQSQHSCAYIHNMHVPVALAKKIAQEQVTED